MAEETPTVPVPERGGPAQVLPAVVRPGAHDYLSTACLHATESGLNHLHASCQLDTRRYDGSYKRAGRCKYCDAPCSCPCHAKPVLRSPR